jgi:hypothetical protein
VQEMDESAFVERVLAEWWDAAAHALPWASMPLDDRFGELKRLASALVSAAVATAGKSRDPQESGARNGVIAAAIDHGRFRGRQGGTWELLLFELTFLSDALRIAVRETTLPAVLTTQLERELAAGLRVAKPACSFGLREAAHEESSPSPERALDADTGPGA